MAKSTKRGLQSMSQDTRMVNIDDIQGDNSGPMGAIKVEALPKNIKPQIEITSGHFVGKVYPMTKPLIMLGRVPDVVDIIVPDDAASRHHAAIGYRANVFTLYDMGSTNGTFVDGDRVNQCKLNHGQEIRIGDTKMRFWID